MNDDQFKAICEKLNDIYIALGSLMWLGVAIMVIDVCIFIAVVLSHP